STMIVSTTRNVRDRRVHPTRSSQQSGASAARTACAHHEQCDRQFEPEASLFRGPPQQQQRPGCHKALGASVATAFHSSKSCPITAKTRGSSRTSVESTN